MKIVAELIAMLSCAVICKKWRIGLSGLIVVLGLFLLIGLLAYGFMPTARHLFCKEKLGRTCEGHRHFMIGVFQIGFAPLFALGLTYVFWQGWSSLVNFVAS